MHVVWLYPAAGCPVVLLQELVVSRLELAHAAMAEKNAANKRLVQASASVLPA